MQPTCARPTPAVLPGTLPSLPLPSHKVLFWLRCRRWGDNRTAAIVHQIALEERNHVAVGEPS